MENAKYAKQTKHAKSSSFFRVLRPIHVFRVLSSLPLHWSSAVTDHDESAPKEWVLVFLVLHQLQRRLPHGFCRRWRSSRAFESGLVSLVELDHEGGRARRLDLPLADDRRRTACDE